MPMPIAQKRYDRGLVDIFQAQAAFPKSNFLYSHQRMSASYKLYNALNHLFPSRTMDHIAAS